MDDKILWIATGKALGYGSAIPAKILERYNTLSDFYNDKNGIKNLEFLSKRQQQSLKSPDFKKAADILKYCNTYNIDVITLEDERYPLSLSRIDNPPAVLYVKGTLPDFVSKVSVTMIGTRDSSINGSIAAATLAYRVAQAGAIVVSGGANGIDTRCTQGALFAGNPGIVVRPCGINNIYLPHLKEIRDDVVKKGGAIISEYEPLARVGKASFQARNRILAALTLGTVVIQAPMKSGCMMTVGYALEMGKDVFAVPGDIAANEYAGSNKILQEGATHVYCARDILNEYFYSYPQQLNLESANIPLAEDDIFRRLQKKYSVPLVGEAEEKPQKRKIPFARSKTKQEGKPQVKNLAKEIKNPPEIDADPLVIDVYECFGAEPLHPDEIVTKTKLNIDDVLFALTELEMSENIISLPGGRFQIK